MAPSCMTSLAKSTLLNRALPANSPGKLGNLVGKKSGKAEILHVVVSFLMTFRQVPPPIPLLNVSVCGKNTVLESF